LTLQIRWFKNISEFVLIDRFPPPNCPIKRKDGKWLVLKDIMFPVAFGRRKLQTKFDHLYFVAENLVLWARSETIGYALNPAASGIGIMEYWNDGMMGLVEWDLFL
jgi:hypothetical protein